MPLWARDFRPGRFTELVFASDAPLQALMWLRQAKMQDSGSILHVTGPSGVGKDILVEIISKVARCKLVEISAEDLKELENVPRKTLKGERILVHIDEPDSASIRRTIALLRKAQVPVIITSLSLKLENVKTIYIPRATTEDTLSAIKAVALKAGAVHNHSFFRAVAERSAGDIRAAINEVQLCREKGTALCRKSVESLTAFCIRVLQERISCEELESRFDGRAVGMCLSSIISSEADWKLAANAIFRCSEADVLPFEYWYLSLARFHEARSKFRYVREELVHEPLPCASSEPQMFIPFSGGRDKIIDEGVQSEIFTYKFMPGSSNAVRRDVSLSEIMNL